jgi:hypothetical protein
MRRYYLLVEFHERHRHPAGAGGQGAIKLEPRADMEMYRDLDKDPGTLVAVTAAHTVEYPWSEVKQAVVGPAPEPKKAKP